MRYLLLSVLMLYAVVASAVMVARDQAGNHVTLLETTCAASQWLQKDWKQAELFYSGKPYKACWRLSGDDVYILDAAGDVSIIPAYAFKQETGV